MAMKTVLVPFPVSGAVTPVLETAYAFAKRFDSYMEGVILEIFASDFMAVDGFGGGWLPPSTKPYIRLIHALWNSCHKLGAVENGSREALRAFCKRFIAHGDDKIAVDPDLLTHQQATPIIKALKEMEARAKAGA